MKDKFIDIIAERYEKLDNQAKNEFWQEYKKKNIDVQSAEVYDLLSDVFAWENKQKENVMTEEKMQVIGSNKRDALLVRQQMTVQEMKEEAQLLYQSGYFTDSVRSVAQAFAKIKAGSELGFPAFYSLNNFVVLPGKPPGVNGQIAGALVKRSGYDYRVIVNTDQVCTIDFFGLKGEKIGTHTVTYEEVSKIVMKTKYGDKKLISKDNWRNYTKLMLFWRTFAQGSRMFCPDALAGLYLVDAEGEVYADILEKENNINSKSESDLSKFKVEVKKDENKKSDKKEEVKEKITEEKVVDAEVVPNLKKTRKEQIDELIVKYGKEKVVQIRSSLKLKTTLTKASDKDFQRAINFLKQVETIDSKVTKAGLKD